MEVLTLTDGRRVAGRHRASRPVAGLRRPAEEDELELENDEFVARLRAAARTFGHDTVIHADTRSDLTEGDDETEPPAAG